MNSTWKLLLGITLCINSIVSSFSIFSLLGLKKNVNHCNDLECPKYTVKQTWGSFELRHYPSYKWAAAVQEGLDYDDAGRLNFKKLFRYISGANDKGVKIPMTAPVINQITITQGPFCAANFTMNFFVPYESQQAPPTPNNPDDKVHIVKMPEMKVYVRSFSGYAEIDDIQENAEKLAKDLEKAGITFDEKHLLFAGYDSPFKLLFRHNEVMLYGK